MKIRMKNEQNKNDQLSFIKKGGFYLNWQNR